MNGKNILIIILGLAVVAFYWYSRKITALVVNNQPAGVS